MSDKKEERVKMFMPLSWWSQMMMGLDRKIETMSQVYGFGTISLDIEIRNGIVKDVVLRDEIRVRQDVPEKSEDENLTPPTKV